jgi:PilZ domain-containing protein
VLGFLKPRGELVELKGRQVVFLATKAYQRDTQFSVKLTLPPPNTQKIDLDIRVLRQRPAPDGKFVTVAVIETPRDFPEVHGYPLRDTRREPRRLTLKSGDLPGYRAVTTDLSLGGFKTELEAELVEDDRIVVTFEFENLNLSIDLLAQVQWVQRKGTAYVTGFSFPDQGKYQEGYQWLCEWFSSEGETEVRKLFRPASLQKTPAIPDSLLKEDEEQTEPDALEKLDEALALRLPFKGFLRGWAWEQGDDMVVVVLEDDEGTDHWLEFPGCRGLHGRCRDRKIRLQGMGMVFDSELIAEYSRSVTLESLYHFQFLDDYARVCLDIVAMECREAKKSSRRD